MVEGVDNASKKHVHIMITHMLTVSVVRHEIPTHKIELHPFSSETGMNLDLNTGA